MICFLHGFTGHPSNFDLITSKLAVPSVALPLLGHAPHLLSVSSTFEAEVDRVAEEIRDFRRKVCLVGYSMGGRIGLSLLIRHPSLFSAAILIGASPGLVTNQEREERVNADARWIEMLQSGEPFDRFLDAWQDQAIFASQRQLPEDTLHQQRKQRSLHNPAGLAAAMGVLGLGRMPNLWPELGKIEVFVQLVVGSLDSKFRAIAERMPFPVNVIEGVGHNVVLEDPAAIARVITNVCEKTC